MLRAILLLAGVGLLTFLLWRLGPTEIVGLLGRVGWDSVPILTLYAAHHCTRALALRMCVLRPGLLRFGDALAIRLSGEAIQSLTLTGPLLAEPTRAWLLKRQGFTLQEGFAATITEYVISSFVTAAMAIASLIYVVQHFAPPALFTGLAMTTVIVFGAFLIASAIAIGRRFYLIGTIIAGLARVGVLRGRLRPDISWINQMEDLLLAILRDRPARVMTVVVIEIGAQALLVLELFLLMQALDVPMTGRFPFLIEGSIKVITIAFVFIPLQVGVAEGAYAMVFTVMGLPPVAGFAIAFLRHIRALVVATVGLAVMARLTRDARVPSHK